MKEARLAIGHEVITFSIPETLKEIPLKRYIDFLVCSRDIDAQDKNSVATMCRAVSYFLGTPLDTIIKMRLGPIDGDISDAIGPTINALFTHAVKVISAASGNLNDGGTLIEYDGEQYRMPAITEQILKGEYILEGLTAIEAIEAIEVQRLVSQTKKTKAYDILKADTGNKKSEVTPQQIERYGDPSGSLTFTMYLRLLSILFRKEGESLPADDSDREAWLNNRSLLFQGIDAQTALNVDFFLSSIFTASGKTHPAAGFLIRQNFVLAAIISPLNRKRTVKRKRTTKRYSSVSAGSN